MSHQHIEAMLALRAINDSSSKCLARVTLARIPGLAGTLVDSAVRYLMERQLVEHHKRGCYRITKLGVQVANSDDGVLKSKTGIAKAATAQQTQGADGIRAAAWRALRIAPQQRLDEILRRIDDGTVPNAGARVSRYFAGLITAGVIVRKKKSYLLVNDLGPIAPTVGAKHTFDPNAGVFLVGGPERQS